MFSPFSSRQLRTSFCSWCLVLLSSSSLHAVSFQDILPDEIEAELVSRCSSSDSYDTSRISNGFAPSIRWKTSVFVTDEYQKNKLKLIEHKFDLDDESFASVKDSNLLLSRKHPLFSERYVKIGKSKYSSSAKWILSLDHQHFSELADRLSMQDINRYQFRKNRPQEIPVSKPDVSEK